MPADLVAGIHPRVTVRPILPASARVCWPTFEWRLPDVRLPLGLIAPPNKALVEIKIVFIALASDVPYLRHMIRRTRFILSRCRANKRLQLRVFNGKRLSTWPITGPTSWVAGGNPPVVSR